jgi:hypothetical protein
MGATWVCRRGASRGGCRAHCSGIADSHQWTRPVHCAFSAWQSCACAPSSRQFRFEQLRVLIRGSAAGVTEAVAHQRTRYRVGGEQAGAHARNAEALAMLLTEQEAAAGRGGRSGAREALLAHVALNASEGIHAAIFASRCLTWRDVSGRESAVIFTHLFTHGPKEKGLHRCRPLKTLAPEVGLEPTTP